MADWPPYLYWACLLTQGAVSSYGGNTTVVAEAFEVIEGREVKKP
jgi:hypothetical protein